MDNQHQKIAGYRDLVQFEIDDINTVKRASEDTQRLIDHLRTLAEIDQRWLSIGETHMQQGYMALVRAIAKPTSF